VQKKKSLTIVNFLIKVYNKPKLILSKIIQVTNIPYQTANVTCKSIPTAQHIHRYFIFMLKMSQAGYLHIYA